MKRLTFVAMMAMLVPVLRAEVSVNVTGLGAEKTLVSVSVGSAAYAKSLKRNLELSGLFKVVADGAIKVTGASGSVTAAGKGKTLSSSETFMDDKSARMAARRFSDALCKAYGNQAGFAQKPIVFLNRGQASAGVATPGELCMCYPDGFDIVQLTRDRQAALYPRWSSDGKSLVYIGFLKGAPQILELDIATGARKTKWNFSGSPTAIAVSPDGRRHAAVLSVHGNPDLYLLEGGRYVRLTNTPLASEGQPTWSPDGTKIAYVSNETRHPQIYVIDVATKKTRRLTARGSQNVDPDWGPDGKIAYITRRGAAYVAVMGEAGDAQAELVTEGANWQHPSWSCDGRHVVADRDKALFVIDTQADPNGKYEKPLQVFSAAGNWNSASWLK